MFEETKTGAWLVRYALERLPISHTFGIPGVHNTELYDEFNKSEKIKPILVTHEGNGAFMADGLSRTSKESIGALLIVPAAGTTHAMSGIAEAYLDGVAMMVISGGVRTDVKFKNQLHQIDQQKIVAGVTKGYWKIEKHSDIIPVFKEAYHLAISGRPGPVFIEVPANIQLFKGEVGDSLKIPLIEKRQESITTELEKEIDRAAQLLIDASAPGIFTGWGAVDVDKYTEIIADLLGAPVATTLQGLSAFSYDHPLHTGMGIGPATVPAVSKAFEKVDTLLALGTAFGEIPTGSFGAEIPENLIHLDIDSQVIGQNYPAKVALVGDANQIVPLLAKKIEEKLEGDKERFAARKNEMITLIKKNKENYIKEWKAHLNDRVNPQIFFESLRNLVNDDAIVALDDGNHTFLAAELYQNRHPRHFISPTDFNCMGHCVPAVIGAKLANPEKQVIGVVGDGAFLMSALEIVTAQQLKLGVVYFIFNDGELSQISQGQEAPYNRKTCTVLPTVQFEGIAKACGAHFLRMTKNDEVNKTIETALNLSYNAPVIVDVEIDYSKKTRFTQGVVKTILKRFTLADKARFIGRALVRKMTK